MGDVWDQPGVPQRGCSLVDAEDTTALEEKVSEPLIGVVEKG